jgi:hypothetical protein
MKGVRFLTDETDHKRYVQLDLNELSNMGHDEIGNVIDEILSENRKNDEQAWEEISKQLGEEGF